MWEYSVTMKGIPTTLKEARVRTVPPDQSPAMA